MTETHKTEVVLAGPQGEPRVCKTPGVCGGDACIRKTRIMVWLLVALKKAGMPDPEILYGYPGLTGEDLAAVWEYYHQYPQEIDEAIARESSLSQRAGAYILLSDLSI